MQIAGPVAAMHTKKMCAEMLDMGCELILIDGAIDRKSIASPETSDAVILSTGAVLSRSMKKVIEDTAHIVELYSLPELSACTARNLITEHMDKEKILIIKGQEKHKNT